mgnify:CR=1 FL=1
MEATAPTPLSMVARLPVCHVKGRGVKPGKKVLKKVYTPVHTSDRRGQGRGDTLTMDTGRYLGGITRKRSDVFVGYAIAGLAFAEAGGAPVNQPDPIPRFVKVWWPGRAP